MTVKKRVVRDQDNLVHLVRRLDKSVNEADWGQLKHARKLLGNVKLDNEVRPLVCVLFTTFSKPKHKGTFGANQLDAQKAREVPRGRLSPAGQAGASMLPVNEVRRCVAVTSYRAAPAPPVKTDLPTVQRLAPVLHLGRRSRPPFYCPGLNAVHNRRSQHGGRRSVYTGAAAARHGTAGGAGGAASLQLWRNTEHFPGALAALLRHAEKMGANLDVMKREREWLGDHRGKALGTTCLAISSVVIVAITFLSMFFVIRFT
ncbi:hypothetical protein EDB83DRAFT_2676479 [Lactarius deliciosus]|nr:hypothetical protein EDB83DRAFT_2676479 [Lactarius deliciosus]